MRLQPVRHQREQQRAGPIRAKPIQASLSMGRGGAGRRSCPSAPAPHAHTARPPSPYVALKAGQRAWRRRSPKLRLSLALRVVYRATRLRTPPRPARPMRASAQPSPIRACRARRQRAAVLPTGLRPGPSSQSPFASQSMRCALLIPRVNPGSLHRCCKSVFFLKQPVAINRRERGLEIPPNQDQTIDSRRPTPRASASVTGHRRGILPHAALHLSPHPLRSTPRQWRCEKLLPAAPRRVRLLLAPPSRARRFHGRGRNTPQLTA